MQVNDAALTQFFRVYKIITSPNDLSDKPLARKLKSNFDELLPRRTTNKGNTEKTTKLFNTDDKVLLKIYKNRKQVWEE